MLRRELRCRLLVRFSIASFTHAVTSQMTFRSKIHADMCVDGTVNYWQVPQVDGNLPPEVTHAHCEVSTIGSMQNRRLCD